VGLGSAVKVGRGVGLGVSVGGRGVLVGTAAWVSATIVNAAEIAVPCTSSGASVGAAGSPPQAARSTASNARVGINFLIIYFLSIFYFNILFKEN
jgi:hypothetical protein